MQSCCSTWKSATASAGQELAARTDSGVRNGPRRIRGGCARVRSNAFFVADIARRYDPTRADFHHCLVNAHKPKMVVRIGLAHKLLVRIKAKARDARATHAYAP
jgi:transposase